MNDEARLVEWLQGRQQLEDAQVEALLERCLAEPEVGHAAKELLLIDEALSWLFDPAREDFGNRMRKVLLMRQSRRLFASRVSAAAKQVAVKPKRRSARAWAVPLAAALLLGIGVGGWLVSEHASEHANEPQPRMQPFSVSTASLPLRIDGSAHIIGADGRRAVTGAVELRPMELLQVDPGARAQLELGDGGTLGCEGGELILTGNADRGWRLELLRGRLRGDLPEPLAAPLTVGTSACLVTVTGTVFTVLSDGPDAEVAVERGSVAVLDLQRNLQRTLGAGDVLRVAGRDQHTLPTILATIIDGSRRVDGLVHLSGGEAPARLRQGLHQDDRESWQVDFDDIGAWFSVALDPVQDWSAADGLLLRLRGSGDGSLYAIEFSDGSATAGGERFVATVSDSSADWRTILLPWSAFSRRQFQPYPDAPDDGLSLRAVGMLGAYRIGSGTGRLLIDEAALYQE